MPIRVSGTFVKHIVGFDSFAVRETSFIDQNKLGFLMRAEL